MGPREDLIRYYRWLRRYGYNDSHSGNASVRDGDTLWVTPSGACADTLESSELVPCSVTGSCGPGASLDAALHVRVYQGSAEAAAVLHSHGPYTVALTLDGADFRPVDFEGSYYFPRVPVISIPYERYLEAAPGAVAEALSHHRIVVVRGHGVYAAAPSLNLAYKWTCSLEQSAMTAFLAARAGTLR